MRPHPSRNQVPEAPRCHFLLAPPSPWAEETSCLSPVLSHHPEPPLPLTDLPGALEWTKQVLNIRADLWWDTAGVW